MFLDIIGFTKIGESMKPDKALQLLNIYFDWIVEIVKKNWWYVDKFLWDWMMIIFSWEYTDNIVKTAVEIEKYIENLNFYWVFKKISIWIWINSWKVIVWTIWSKKRMEITVIWDVVNTAAKLEWLTRKYKYQILITQEVYDKIKNKEDFLIDEVWEKNIKWRKRKIKILGVNYSKDK
jgi:adenylate cyclase